MIWFTWRQFRTQTWITLAAIGAIAAVLAVTGIHLTHLWTDSGAAACQGSCDAPVSQFLSAVEADGTYLYYNVSSLVLYAVPGLIGLFWGAPLVARELEAGTYRLAWNQSVTRTRWLATKLALIGGASMATTGLLSLVIGFWARHLDGQTRIGPLLFGVRGITPIGYAAFAFALGVAAGMFIRRTVPAMAVTLAGYIGAVASMPLWLRARLLPARHVLAPLDTSRLDALLIAPGHRIRVTGRSTVPGWVLDNHTVTSTGQPFNGIADPVACGRNGSARSCLQWIGTLNLRESLTYQPVSHFWPLQFVETGIFLALAALLAALCLRHVRRMT